MNDFKNSIEFIIYATSTAAAATAVFLWQSIDTKWLIAKYFPSLKSTAILKIYDDLWQCMKIPEKLNIKKIPEI